MSAVTPMSHILEPLGVSNLDCQAYKDIIVPTATICSSRKRKRPLEQEDSEYEDSTRRSKTIKCNYDDDVHGKTQTMENEIATRPKHPLPSSICFTQIKSTSPSTRAEPAQVLPSLKRKPSRRQSPPLPRWLFSIHEDSPKERLDNLVTHHTYILTNDEGVSSDHRGKENIPPADYITIPRTTMLGTARIPLGNIEVAQILYIEAT